MVLTTVQGNECLVSETLLDKVYEHVTPFMEADSMDTVALRTLHRFRRYIVPVKNMGHHPELVLNAMRLANTFREMRKGAPKGKDVVYTEDRMFEVLQTSIDEMQHPQHPEYPVYYRYRILRSLPNGNIHRLTQDSILHFTWLESVNEHPNESVALEMLERTMPQWGFDYQPRPTAQDTTFPDGQAFIDGELSNLEIISIQPRYPGGHSLHDLVALTRVGRADKPAGAPLLRCWTCRSIQVLEEATWGNLPEHDASHRWVMYVPRTSYAPDFPFDLAATPLININQENFTNELVRAIQTKSVKFAKQGKGLRNWVVVLAQGFPVDADWYNEIPSHWPENVDGVCVVATEEYVGAYNHLVPFKDFTVLLLKCPSGSQDHNCYHPGYSYRVSGIDTDFQPLSKDFHTIEEVSAAAWSYPLPASPVRKTLVIRDQDEREIQTLLGADVTDSQVAEILDAAVYGWRKHPFGTFVLCSEGGAANGDRCSAEVQRGTSGQWVGGVSYQCHQLQEEFTSLEDAKRWCERQTAMLLLHTDG